MATCLHSPSGKARHASQWRSTERPGLRAAQSLKFAEHLNYNTGSHLSDPVFLAILSNVSLSATFFASTVARLATQFLQSLSPTCLTHFSRLALPPPFFWPCRFILIRQQAGKVHYRTFSDLSLQSFIPHFWLMQHIIWAAGKGVRAYKWKKRNI